LNDIVKSLKSATEILGRAKETTTEINHPYLQESLDGRCTQLESEISRLEEKVRTTASVDRRQQWIDYQKLLDLDARPTFVEYVDFLGGLTVRDTGLDDRICDMTGELLTRFNSITPQALTLPLPARHAALGNALDGLVLLGFPEWSIWGIPLVGHEIGLGYVRDPKHQAGLTDLVKKFTPMVPHCDRPAEERESNAKAYLDQLVADCFATYILGFSYACAGLLLRLTPRHDEVRSPTMPRDIDRARVIMMTLHGGDAGPDAGGTFSDAVGGLQKIWESAVRAYAGPDQAAEALEEAKGPPPKDDWLDDFTEMAIEHFTNSRLIQPYDNDRWTQSDTWQSHLATTATGTMERRSWRPKGAAVADVLTAAWRMRLMDDADPDSVARRVLASWSKRIKGGA
jgi:hypothetical protein